MLDYIKKFLVTYANHIIRLLLVTGSNIIIARYLGPSGKGTLTLMMSFLAIVIMVGMVGLDEANVYFISSKKISHRRIFTHALYQTIILSILCLIIFIIIKDWMLHNVLKGITQKHFYILLVVIPFYFFNQHTRTILLGHRSIYSFNLYVIAQFLILFIIHLIFIPIYGLFGGVLSIIVAALVLTISGIILLLRHGAPSFKIDLTDIKKSYSYGIRSQLGLVSSFLNRRLDLFIVNYFLNPYQVGLYAIAVAVAELPWHVPAAAATVLFPWIADKSRDDAAKFTAYVLRNVIFITVIAIIFLILLGRLIITMLFGDAFQGSVVLMYILLPGILGLGVTKILGGHFQGSGRPELGTIMVIFSLIETVILDMFFIPKMGALGAAVASSIAYMTSAVIGLTLFTKIWKVRLIDAIVPRWNEMNKVQDFLKSLKKNRRSL